MYWELHRARPFVLIIFWQPFTPTQKAFRASYRASTTGCIIHDTSYYSSIVLKGHVDDIRNVFAKISDPTEASLTSARCAYPWDLAKTNHLHDFVNKDTLRGYGLDRSRYTTPSSIPRD
jgi:hypothetical protein